MRSGALKAKRPGANGAAARQPWADLTWYGLAALSVGAALGLALLFQHLQFRDTAAPLLLSAVAISSWYGGPRPAALAAILSIGAFYWHLVEPVRTVYISPAEIPYFIIFVAFVSLLSWYSTIRRRAEEGLRERARQIGSKLVILSEAGAGTDIDLSVAGSIAYAEPRSGRFRFSAFPNLAG